MTDAALARDAEVDARRRIPGIDEDDLNLTPIEAYGVALREARRNPGLEDLPDTPARMTPAQQQRLTDYKPDEQASQVGQLRKVVEDLVRQIDELKNPKRI